MDCSSIFPQTILESQNHRTSVLGETCYRHSQSPSLFKWGNRGAEWSWQKPQTAGGRDRALVVTLTLFPSSTRPLGCTHRTTFLSFPAISSLHSTCTVICLWDDQCGFSKNWETIWPAQGIPKQSHSRIYICMEFYLVTFLRLLQFGRTSKSKPTLI